MDKKEKTRLKIFKATLELFSKYGIMKTTLGDIAKKVGMAKPSLYYYFPSKNSIIDCTVRWLISKYITEAKELLDSDISHSDKISGYIHLHFNWTNRYFKEFTPVLDEVFAMMPRIFKDLGGEFVDEIHSMILEVVDDGIKKDIFVVNHPAEFVHMVLFSLRGLETNIYYRQQDGIEMINEFARVIIRGIEK